MKDINNFFRKDNYNKILLSFRYLLNLKIVLAIFLISHISLLKSQCNIGFSPKLTHFCVYSDTTVQLKAYDTTITGGLPTGCWVIPGFRVQFLLNSGSASNVYIYVYQNKILKMKILHYLY